jgi:transketolase
LGYYKITTSHKNSITRILQGFYLPKYQNITADNYSGRNIAFGVREHAMGSILNGLALTGFRCFGSTFLSFSDYLKPAMRMSSLMNLPVTYIFTHDSINVGQDGPTHQPIEQLAMLRSQPNLNVYRPAGAYEIVGCWQQILNSNTPSALVLSRQETSFLGSSNIDEVKHGAYIVKKEQGTLDGIIIATGSEVQTALLVAAQIFAKDKKDIRVVSMPCVELFEKESSPTLDATIDAQIGAKKLKANFEISTEDGTSLKLTITALPEYLEDNLELGASFELKYTPLLSATYNLVTE